MSPGPKKETAAYGVLMTAFMTQGSAVVLFAVALAMIGLTVRHHD